MKESDEKNQINPKINKQEQKEKIRESGQENNNESGRMNADEEFLSKGRRSEQSTVSVCGLHFFMNNTLRHSDSFSMDCVLVQEALDEKKQIP
jgi:hypothetical protein